MNVDLFDFDLPEHAIAVRPAVPRESAKLLHVPAGMPLADYSVADLTGLLRAGDLLVSNDTKVIPARLHGKRGEAKVEITLHKRVDALTWQVFARPARKCRLDDVLEFAGLKVQIVHVGDAGERTVTFLCKAEEVMPELARVGSMPLPPYIASKRAADKQDEADYQTIFADKEGAVAAPTAGLHFTPQLLHALKAKGVQHATVTLHVGAGTFLPVKAGDTADHKMHSETGILSKEVAALVNETRSQGGRVIAVGTTSLRLLESATDEAGVTHAYAGDTDIFITPGRKVRSADMLLTNFHLPRSTLFMLVSAFSGLEVMQGAYQHAIENGYRFYSYGDACLLENTSNSHTNASSVSAA